MRVDRAEVELAGDQEDHCPDRRQARESAGASLGGLDLTVKGLQESVGLTCLRPSHDALDVTTHESGNLLHWLDLGARDAGALVLELDMHDVELLAIEDLAQLFFLDPRPRSTHGGEFRDHVIENSGHFGWRQWASLRQR